MHLFSRFSRTKAFKRGLIAGGMDVSYISPLFPRAPAVFPLPPGGWVPHKRFKRKSAGPQPQPPLLPRALGPTPGRNCNVTFTAYCPLPVDTKQKSMKKF